MSAFTEPLAQVLEALNKPWCPNLGSCPPDMHSGCSYCAAHEDALSALAQVERLATDMETALRTMPCKCQSEFVLCARCAVLSASGTPEGVAREEGAA